jgi:hypothetical protein
MTMILVLVAYLGTASRALRKFTSSAYKLAMLLIGLSGEWSVTRYAAIVVSRLCSMTAAGEGICTSIAGRVFKSARTRKTAAALARSLEQREQISVRWLLDCYWSASSKAFNKNAGRDASPFRSSRNRNWPAGSFPGTPGVRARCTARKV